MRWLLLSVRGDDKTQRRYRSGAQRMCVAVRAVLESPGVVWLSAMPSGSVHVNLSVPRFIPSHSTETPGSMSGLNVSGSTSLPVTRFLT